MKKLIIEPLIPLDQALLLASAEDISQASAFHSFQRQRERLSWRAVLRREIPEPIFIRYNSVGAPEIYNEDGVQGLHIGVSHCRDWLALVISDNPCAVDIETLDRRFDRIHSRYLTPSELVLSDDDMWLAVGWCAKEVLYKLSGLQGLDLLNDLHILSANLPQNTLLAQILNQPPITLNIHYGQDFVAVSFI